MLDWLHQLYSQEGLQHLLATGGLLALIIIIFAETGLFLGFFLPGDSLLMTAGVACQLDPLHKDGLALLSFWPVVLAVTIAAIVGNCVNFWLGRVSGDRMRDRPDGRLFKRRYLAEAEEFYHRYGGWAIVAGRFFPVIRTFVPFAAGMAGMRWPPFLLWTVIGGTAWVGSMTTIGYLLAKSQTMVEHLHYLVLAIIALSFVPIGIGVLNRWRRKPIAPTASGPGAVGTPPRSE